jgi:iron complex outermembrane receptor protein
VSNKFVVRRSVSLILAAMASTAWGQDAVYNLGEVLVTAPQTSGQSLDATSLNPRHLDRLRPGNSDTASLLRDVPGVSLYGAGGVSSLPVIHGLADDRLRTQVDGMDLIAACPNHMNPALSYIDPSRVGKVTVYAGIVPVSVGGDSIGGSIVVESARPVFASPGAGVLTQGEVGAFYRSNGDARGVNGSVTLAGEKLSVSYAGSVAQSDDYKAGADFKATTATGQAGHTLALDEIGSTAYKSINQALDIALRSDEHLFDLKLVHQHIPYEWFPNQRMDMTDNKSDQIDLGYSGQYGWGVLKARAYHEETQHKMDFGGDKRFWYGTASGGPGAPNGSPCSPIGMTCATGMPMDTEGKTTGASVKGDILLSGRDTVRVGAEYQSYQLDDWWAPSGSGMWPGTFWNINNGQRDRYALFGEWEAKYSPQWTSLIGLRHETVEMDTAAVRGYNTAATAMGNQYADMNAFNAKGHAKTDQNWDFTALARFTPDTTRSYEFGYAQKTRSPNLYERYSWSSWTMAAVMNNFVGDGNGYVGNLDLKPEVAHTISATADWHDAAKEQWGLKATPYYTYVQDYIDARCLPGATCTANKFNALQYVNQSARIYGLDVSGNYQLASTDGYGNFTLTGVLNYVRGKNRTTDDNLYNIMPLNGKLALVQRIGQWTNTAEAQFVAGKKDVSRVRNEIATGGYSLFNLRSSYEWKKARLDVGIDNLFDKAYSLPLGGAYAGQGTTMSINGIPWGVAVPGMGRSINASLNVKF